MRAASRFVVLLAVVLAVSAAFASTEGEEADGATGGTCGDGLSWCMDGDELFIIADGSGSGSMFDYDDCGPWSYEIRSVTFVGEVKSIGSYAFYCCDSLASVGIPSSVTSVGPCAFAYCTALASVGIPSSVTYVGEYAFVGCTALGSIGVDGSNPVFESLDGVLFDKGRTALLGYPAGRAGPYQIPSSVTSVGEGAFYGCTSLSSVGIPSSVTSVGDCAFVDCTSLASVDMPSVESVGECAFEGCTSLDSVRIPSSVTSIGEGAFPFDFYGPDGAERLTCEEIPGHAFSRAGSKFIMADDACGHSWQVESEVSPTCTVEGVRTYRCALCGETKIETVPPAGHAVGDWSSDGERHWHVCEACGETMDEGEHEFGGDGRCVACGYVPYAPGDFNGDGAVDSDDVVYLLYHVFFPDKYPVDQPCDFNGDGAVDSDDALYLLYHCFFPEEYPLVC